MCGIFGSITKNSVNLQKKDFLKCLDVINHRGPDDQGYKEYKLNNFNIHLGHKRLSILDLDKRANQPMQSSSGRYVIIYNGEIYNHLELRKIIENYKQTTWKTTSDTETLLEITENFGIKYLLKHVEGMFAFCLLDLFEKKFYFSRDRVGEKPLYIAMDEKAIYFSSDLGPIKKIPFFKKVINQSSLQKYLKFNYIPTPHSIYENCYKIYPGELIVIDFNYFCFSKHNSYESFLNAPGVDIFKWWSPKNFIHSSSNQFNKEENIKEIKKILIKSISNQLLADVSVGAFLSGGIDSTLIATLISQINSNIDCFTIGYEFDDYDESKYAIKIANYLNLKHHTHICSKRDALDIIPKLYNIYQEPFADSSQIPTTLISQIASKHVKVILSGDGGDELFGGYNRYLLANKYWKYLQYMPSIFLQNLKYISKLIPNKLLIEILKNFH